MIHRKQIANFLRSMADDVEQTGNSDRLAFAIFEHDEIDPAKFDCIGVPDDADETFEHFRNLL